MPALQREAFWAKERLLGDLRQSVPQNGRVHLLGVDFQFLQCKSYVTSRGHSPAGAEIWRRREIAVFLRSWRGGAGRGILAARGGLVGP